MAWKLIARSSVVLGLVIAALTLYFTAGLYYGWNIPITPVAAPPPTPAATMTLPVWSLLVLGLVGVLLLVTAWAMMAIRLHGERRIGAALEPNWTIHEF